MKVIVLIPPQLKDFGLEPHLENEELSLARTPRFDEIMLLSL